MERGRGIDEKTHVAWAQTREKAGKNVGEHLRRLDTGGLSRVACIVDEA